MYSPSCIISVRWFSRSNSANILVMVCTLTALFIFCMATAVDFMASAMAWCDLTVCNLRATPCKWLRISINFVMYWRVRTKSWSKKEEDEQQQYKERTTPNSHVSRTREDAKEHEWLQGREKGFTQISVAPLRYHNLLTHLGHDFDRRHLIFPCRLFNFHC